jgi:hypothetical protein
MASFYLDVEDPGPASILRIITINPQNCLIEHVVLTRLTYSSSANSDAYRVDVVKQLAYRSVIG